jgi:hypothetical protein
MSSQKIERRVHNNTWWTFRKMCGTKQTHKANQTLKIGTSFLYTNNWIKLDGLSKQVGG